MGKGEVVHLFSHQTEIMSVFENAPFQLAKTGSSAPKLMSLVETIIMSSSARLSNQIKLVSWLTLKCSH